MRATTKAIDEVRRAGAWQRVRRTIPLPILCLFGVDLVLTALHLFGPPLPAWAALPAARDTFWNMGREGNVPAAYSGVQLALIGVLMSGFASVWTRRRGAALALACVGAVFLLLSLDELAGIHEKFGRSLTTVIGQRGETALPRTGPWMLVLAPVFLSALPWQPTQGVTCSVAARRSGCSTRRDSWSTLAPWRDSSSCRTSSRRHPVVRSDRRRGDGRDGRRDPDPVGELRAPALPRSPSLRPRGRP